MERRTKINNREKQKQTKGVTKMAKKILNQIVQHMNFYFDCSHCCTLNDDFTDPDQITQGIECESCGKANYFDEF